MRTESIERFLDALATRARPDGPPGWGAGASAALHAAQGAALVARVARSRDGDRSGDPSHLADLAAATLEAADACREDALRLALDDADAAERLGLATGLPRATTAEHETRSTAVAAGLLGAARVSARTIRLSARILGLAERLRPTAPRHVVGDVAAAAEALRAALGTARVHVELHLRGISEPDAREELLEAVEAVDDLVLRAARTTATAREQILR